MAASVTGAVGVPRLALRAWRGGLGRKGVIYYEEAGHREIPHVVKFSGGRSSGLMLLILLENGLLKPERGDVVLFTNTSAEHPATYDFVARMKRVTERAGIPFFLAELCTVETVIAGMWRRRRSYRLANSRPALDKNLQGYSHRGEVFEEAVAMAGMLPSVHTRVCTTLMKMYVTREFLSDWFGGGKGIPMQGHAGAETQVDVEALYRDHLKSNGKMSEAEFAKRMRALEKRPASRPAQEYRKFTGAPLLPHANAMLRENAFGGRCSLFGEQPVSFLTFLGFRAGEDARYQRMMSRNRGEQTPGHNTHPPGEVSCSPLFDLGIDQRKVLEFWKRQPASLRPRLPEDINLSNCVYCFLKGSRALSDIQCGKGEFEKSLPKPLRQACDLETPNSLDWWIRLENDYKRQANQNGRNGKGPPRTFGMFGLKDMDYHRIKEYAAVQPACGGKAPLPPTLNCECTD